MEDMVVLKLLMDQQNEVKHSPELHGPWQNSGDEEVQNDNKYGTI